MSPDVLYISGYGRSGSTILDVLLGAHPKIFGAGEVTHLFRDAAECAPCSCGAPLPSCPLWSAVFERANLTPGSGAFQEAAWISRRVDTWPHLGTGRPRERRAYADLWQTIFGAVAAELQVDVIVDSSKTTRLSRNRAGALRDSGFQVAVAHLTRHPSDVLVSAMRGSNRDLEKGRARTGVLTQYRAAAGWLGANLWAWKHGGWKSSAHISYESLMVEPTKTVARMLRLVELDTAPIARYLEGEPIPPGHGVAGNRLRRQDAIRFRPGPTRPTSDRPNAVARALMSPVARGFGYRYDG